MEFLTIKEIVLKESSDHYTIMILKPGSSICQSLPPLTDQSFRFLCNLFEIPYHKEWSYGGDQIHIPKRPTKKQN